MPINTSSMPGLRCRFLLILGTWVLAYTGWLIGSRVVAQPADKEPFGARQDFRGQPIDEQFFKVTGETEQIKEEAGGLRIKLPGVNPRPEPTGVLARFRVKGDCEITTSYEVVRADKPSEGWGIGVSLWVMALSPGRDAAYLGNLHQKDGQKYVCQRMTTSAEGKRQYVTRVFPTQVRSGKLRLVRTGESMSYQVAEDGANDFRELCALAMVPEDLNYVRAAAETSKTTTPVEACFFDFAIRGPQVPVPVVAAEAPKAEMVRPKARGWLAAGAAVVLILTATLSLLTWLAFRRRRHLDTDSGAVKLDDQDSATGPELLLTLACAACRKNLKVSPKLAGKKVRCPKCAAPVLVPSLQAKD